MANFLSDQLTQVAATGLAAPQKLDMGDDGGRLRVKHFSFTGDVAQNDTVQLVELPAGARVYFGRVDFTDFGTGVTIDIGDGVDVDHYADGLDVSTAAGQADFANTVALNGLGSEQITPAAPATSIFLTATFLGADPASGTLEGYIAYSE